MLLRSAAASAASCSSPRVWLSARQSCKAAGLAFQARRMASSFKLKDAGLWKDECYIDGKWVKGSSTFSVTDPATGKEIGKVPELGVQETRDAVNAAAKAFKTWGKTTAKERYDLMMKLFRLMSDNSHDLAQICTLENGKPMTDSKGEIAYSASFLEWFAGEAVKDTGDVIPHPMPNIRSIVIKQPIGVCGIIT